MCGEARPDSDVDILAHPQPGRTLFDMAGFEQDASDLLGGVKVDVISDQAIKEILAPYILAEAVKAYMKKLDPDIVRLSDILQAITDIEDYKITTLTLKKDIHAVCYNIALSVRHLAVSWRSYSRNTQKSPGSRLPASGMR